jgi:probable rRNA maturation factor
VTLAVTVGAEVPRVALARSRAQRLARAVLHAEGVRHALVSIAFVTPRTIARLNSAHLGHRGPTDVIAFAFAPRRSTRTRRRGHAHTSDGIVGDVYIAPAIARQNATRWHVGVREELARLVVHGILHVVGYDHPEGADRMHTPMWRRQEGLLRRLAGARA